MTRNLFFIAIITVFALVISAPKNFPLNFSVFDKSYSLNLSSPEIHLTGPVEFHRDLDLKYGLDLQGGLEVILEADMSKIGLEDRQDALESSREVISRRVDLYGVSEAVVKTVVSDDKYRISVSLPGVENKEESLALIGQTASLDFRELPVATDSATFGDFVQTGLEGKDLKKATVQFDPNNGKPVVGLEFTEEGAAKFGEITERNVGNPLGIFLDGYPITSPPTVSEPIYDGQAVINGEFTVDESKNLAVQLNAGALPVPIEVIKEQSIAPTLGALSVEKSLRAGAIGLGAVALFMVLLYGWSGAVALIGLVIYGLLTLTLYKLVPITLTLPGLAGFILSIGMAVDANILTFERVKEELRKGHSRERALELGFGRAWDSIKDANIATLITTFILFNPLDWPILNSSGMIRGFALTLGLGVLLSLFTGIYVTRNLLRSLYGKK